MIATNAKCKEFDSKFELMQYHSEGSKDLTSYSCKFLHHTNSLTASILINKTTIQEYE